MWREAVLLKQVVVEHSNCANAKLPIARVLMCLSEISCRKVSWAFGIPLGSQLQNLSNSQKPESFVLDLTIRIYLTMTLKQSGRQVCTQSEMLRLVACFFLWPSPIQRRCAGVKMALLVLFLACIPSVSGIETLEQHENCLQKW